MSTTRFDQRILVTAVLLALASTALGQDDPFALEDVPVATPEEIEAKAQAKRELTERRNWVEVGAGWVSDDSLRFGRYNGLEDDGLFGILNFELGSNAPWDAPRAPQWSLAGSTLGLDTRELRYALGEQGRWRVTAGYDELAQRRGEGAQTIFTNPGSTRLVLPSNWVGAQNTAGMTRLGASLQDLTLEQMRRRLDLGFQGTLRKWQFETSYRREDKSGTKTIGGVIGNSGGNPRAILLPEPVEYSTDMIDAAVRWGDAKRQVQAAYHVSLFENANDALAWQNPYTNINGWTAAGFPNGFGSLSLPPDNQFHQASLAAAWNVSPRVRATADAALGRLRQNEAFLPYTINPTLAASVTQPLPRDSLDGRIDTTLVNLRLAARPTDRWTVNGLVRYDDRDNDTPRSEYVYIGGDSNTQNTAANSSFRRFNEPYSYREEKARLDSGYRLGDRWHIDGSAERRRIERTYSEREEADESTITLGLRGQFFDWIAGSVRVARAERDGSTYIGNEPFLSGYAPGYTSTVPGQFENPPLLRKFHLADRDRETATARIDVTPGEQWTVGFNANWAEDDYDMSEIGLEKSRIQDLTVDVAWVPRPDLTTYGFYTYEKLASNQDGQSIGGNTRVADAANPARSWFADHRDRIRTWGLGATHECMDGKLDLGADFVRSRSTSDIFVSTGSALTSRPLPRDRTELDSVGLSARWKFRRDVALTLQYRYEDYASSDFALDDVEANQLANVILLGETSPDYEVHVVGLSVTIAF